MTPLSHTQDTTLTHSHDYAQTYGFDNIAFVRNKFEQTQPMSSAIVPRKTKIENPLLQPYKSSNKPSSQEEKKSVSIAGIFLEARLQSSHDALDFIYCKIRAYQQGWEYSESVKRHKLQLMKRWIVKKMNIDLGRRLYIFGELITDLSTCDNERFSSIKESFHEAFEYITLLYSEQFENIEELINFVSYFITGKTDKALFEQFQYIVSRISSPKIGPMKPLTAQASRVVESVKTQVNVTSQQKPMQDLRVSLSKNNKKEQDNEPVSTGFSPEQSLFLPLDAGETHITKEQYIACLTELCKLADKIKNMQQGSARLVLKEQFHKEKAFFRELEYRGGFEKFDFSTDTIQSVLKKNLKKWNSDGNFIQKLFRYLGGRITK